MPRKARLLLVTNIYTTCHPERSASTICLLTIAMGAESKDPDGVSFAMPYQEVLTRTSFAHA